VPANDHHDDCCSTAWATAHRKNPTAGAIGFLQRFCLVYVCGAFFSILCWAESLTLADGARHLMFEWPSICLRIEHSLAMGPLVLALSVLFAAQCFVEADLQTWIRYLFDPQWSAGSCGYWWVFVGGKYANPQHWNWFGMQGIFPFAALLIALLFWWHTELPVKLRPSPLARNRPILFSRFPVRSGFATASLARKVDFQRQPEAIFNALSRSAHPHRWVVGSFMAAA